MTAWWSVVERGMDGRKDGLEGRCEGGVEGLFSLKLLHLPDLQIDPGTDERQTCLVWK